MNTTIKEQVAGIKSKIDAAGGLKHVYFVACGGSKAAIFPGCYLLEHEAKTFGVSTYNSNEFVHATPKALDERCIAIICSLKATAETVEAVKVANAAGAVTFAMTGNYQTGMAKVGQEIVVYSNGDVQDYSESNGADSLMLGIEILNQFEGWDLYDKAIASFDKVNDIVAEAKEECVPEATEWAKKVKDEPLFYILASGSLYDTAYSMTMCHMMEMQWKFASIVHDGEYFHGPFEITDTVPMILFMNEGKTRFLDERALKFLNKHAKNFIVIDYEKINKGRIDHEVAEFSAPIVMNPVERYYVWLLSQQTRHSMDDRRYMWKEEY